MASRNDWWERIYCIIWNQQVYPSISEMFTHFQGTQNWLLWQQNKLTFPPISWIHSNSISRGWWRTPGSWAMTATSTPVLWRRFPLPGSSTPIAIIRGSLCQEVGRNQPPNPIQLAHVEPIIIHFTVYIDDVARLERQLHLQWYPDNSRYSQHSHKCTWWSHQFHGKWHV